MLKVLIVGCGSLGGAVAIQLAEMGIKTVGVKRGLDTIEGVGIIQADVTQPASLQALIHLHPEILIYCVAASGQTDAQYKSHYVDGFRHVLATQSDNLKLKHVFFVSSTRVYGQKSNALLDESTVAIPNDFGGERLLEAEQLLSTLTCNTTVLRLSGIYGPDRLRMVNLARLPESWPVKNSWSNRIHLKDASAFIVFLVKQVLVNKAIQDCYIVTDSSPATQYEVLNWLALKLNAESQDCTQAKINKPVDEGKRLSNQSLLASGFTLEYPDYQSGYLALLDEIFPTQLPSL